MERSDPTSLSPTLPHAPSSPASCRGEYKRSSQNQSMRAEALFVKATLVRREAVRVAFLPGRWDAHESFHDSRISNLGLHLWPRRKHKAPFLFFCLYCLPHGSHRLPDTVQSPSSPLGLQRPPAYWFGLSIGQNSRPWTFVDLGEHLFKSTPG